MLNNGCTSIVRVVPSLAASNLFKERIRVVLEILELYPVDGSSLFPPHRASKVALNHLGVKYKIFMPTIYIVASQNIG
jgi:hypothetical protein